MGFVLWLVIGGVAGWLAGNIMKGGGYGIPMNIVLGIVGAFVGGWAFGLLGIQMDSMIGSLVTATVGAVVVLWIAGMIKK